MKKNHNLIIIGLAVISGLVAGVCGEIITRVYILKDYSFPYIGEELNLSGYGQGGLVIRDPKKVVVNQDLKVTETASSLSSSLVSVYKALPEKTDPLKPAYYDLNDPVFVGLAITADGWVIASLPADVKDFSAKGFVAIAGDGKIYKIDRLTNFKEYPGTVVFFHLEGAANLAVRKLNPQSELAQGQSLLVYDNQKNIYPATLSALKADTSVRSSDSVNLRLKLAGSESLLPTEAFIFDLAGNLSGLVSGGQMMPAYAYDLSWQRFLRQGTSTHAILGINYISLSSVRLAGQAQSQKGALIYGSPAIVKDSPAAKAGLQAGDIITWVDNQEIKDGAELSEIIASYQPGSKIRISYLRAGGEREVTLNLGSSK